MTNMYSEIAYIRLHYPMHSVIKLRGGDTAIVSDIIAQKSPFRVRT